MFGHDLVVEIRSSSVGLNELRNLSCMVQISSDEPDNIHSLAERLMGSTVSGSSHFDIGRSSFDPSPATSTRNVFSTLHSHMGAASHFTRSRIAEVRINSVKQSQKNPQRYLLEFTPLQAELMLNDALIKKAVENGLEKCCRGMFSIVSWSCSDRSEFDAVPELKRIPMRSIPTLRTEELKSSLPTFTPKPTQSFNWLETEPSKGAFYAKAMALAAKDTRELEGLYRKLTGLEFKKVEGTPEEKQATDLNVKAVKAIKEKNYIEALKNLSEAFRVLFTIIRNCKKDDEMFAFEDPNRVRAVNARGLLASVCSNISSVFRDGESRNLELAREFMQKAVGIKERVSGMADPDVLKAKEKLHGIEALIANAASSSSTSTFRPF